MRIEFVEVVGRARVLIDRLASFDRRWLLFGGAGGVIVVVLLVVWLLSGDSSPNTGSLVVEDLRMSVACGACKFRAEMPLSEIRALPTHADGLMTCPQCAAPALDRYRRGSAGTLRVEVDAPSGDPG